VAVDTGPVVSSDNTIWVRDRNDLEDYALPELTRLQGVSQKVLNKSLHHERGIRLPWMDPGHNQDVFFALIKWHTKPAIVVFELCHLDQLVALLV
jgi:hypothetical protein